MSLCFEAAAAAGTLRLALADEPGDAVTAAMALALHEPVIAALEDWLQQALDPQPVAQDDPAPPLIWADAGELRIGLPWAMLRTLPRAPALPLCWPELVFRVDVATFDSAPLPSDADAGVLLLPPTFEPPWRLRLHDDRHGLVADAEWHGPGSELRLRAAPESDATTRQAWRVELDDTCHRPLPQVLGWEPATQAWRPGAQATLKRPDGSLRAGRIVPALHGFGLWLAA